jgi:hypothetical protein
MKLTEQDNSDIIFIQKPYLYKNRIAGLTKLYRKYISLVDKSRADILITKNKIDAVFITQLTNNLLLKALKNWEIREEESCSDHSIINFDIGQDIYHDTEYYLNGHRYVVIDENLKKFDNNLSRIVAMNFRTGQEESANLDRVLASQVKKTNHIERAVDLFQEALISLCNKSFRTRWATKKTTKHKSVPRWKEELTLKRKRINALRRRYQRTTYNDDPTERRKSQYHEEKSKYQAAIKREKIKSWK